MDRFTTLPEMSSDADAKTRAAAQKTLSTYLNDEESVLCLVFEKGPDSDKAADVARKTSEKAEFCNVSFVIRVPDLRVLLDEQRTAWLAGVPRTVLLATDRSVAVKLKGSDATKSFKVQKAFADACATGDA